MSKLLAFFVIGFWPTFLSATDINLVRQAQAAFNDGRYDVSEKAAYEGLEQYPDSLYKPDFLLLLSASYLKKGEPEQAQAVLNGVLALYPGLEKNNQARLLAAAVSQGLQEFDKAQDILKNMGNDMALYQSAYLFEKTGQSFAAISQLRKLEEKFPESLLQEAVHLSLARSYLTLGELDVAALELEKSDSALSDYLRGMLAMKAGDAAVGVKQFTDWANRQNSLKDACFAWVKTGTEEGFLKGMASQVEPCFTASALGLSEIYMRRQEPEKVVSLMNTALAENSSSKNRFRRVRGVAYQHLGKTSEAVQDFDVSKSFVLMAQTLWMDHDYSRLVTDFQKTLNAHRKEIDKIELIQCDLIVAETHMILRRSKEAEAIYHNILSQAPPVHLTAQAVSGLVACLASQEKYADASRRIEELMIRFGEDREVVRFGLMAQADLQWNDQKYAEAARQYERYIQMFPDDERTPSATYQLGQCHYKMGDTKKAVEVWADLRKASPSSPAAFQALTQLAAVTGSPAYYAELAKGENSSVAEAALLQVARNDFKAGRMAQSISNLDQYFSRFPSSSHSSEAVDLLKQAYLQTALVNPQGLESLAATYAASFHGGEAIFRIGMNAFNRGDMKSAAGHFQQVWSRYPRAPSVHQALFYQAETEYRLNEFSKCIATFQQFLTQNPEHDLAPIARFHRGKALAATGQNQEAAFAFKQLIERSPRSSYAASAYLEWAKVLEKDNDVDGQIRIYEKFIADFPQHSQVDPVLWQLGVLNKRQGLFEVSLRYLRMIPSSSANIKSVELNRAISELEGVVK